jgi:HAD superfamily hydrolase (TIGR01509 family)
LPFLVSHQLEFLGDFDAAPTRQFAKEVRSSSGRQELVKRISQAFVKESIAGMAWSRNVLAALEPRLKIGVVSNFYGNLARILDDADFTGLIAALADSGRLGLYKPDLTIYYAALAMLGFPASATVMVGDSLNKDIAPAQALGMKTVWLRHREVAVADECARSHADFTITSLAELNDLL